MEVSYALTIELCRNLLYHRNIRLLKIGSTCPVITPSVGVYGLPGCKQFYVHVVQSLRFSTRLQAIFVWCGRCSALARTSRHLQLLARRFHASPVTCVFVFLFKPLFSASLILFPDFLINFLPPSYFSIFFFKKKCTRAAWKNQFPISATFIPLICGDFN